MIDIISLGLVISQNDWILAGTHKTGKRGTPSAV